MDISQFIESLPIKIVAITETDNLNSDARHKWFKILALAIILVL